jgi:hypothetical protein
VASKGNQENKRPCQGQRRQQKFPITTIATAQKESLSSIGLFDELRVDIADISHQPTYPTCDSLNEFGIRADPNLKPT